MSAQLAKPAALRKAKLDVAEQELDGRLLDLANQLGELERAGLTGDLRQALGATTDVDLPHLPMRLKRSPPVMRRWSGFVRLLDPAGNLRASYRSRMGARTLRRNAPIESLTPSWPTRRPRTRPSLAGCGRRR